MFGHQLTFQLAFAIRNQKLQLLVVAKGQDVCALLAVDGKHTGKNKKAVIASLT